jgi:hypothetical protein
MGGRDGRDFGKGVRGRECGELEELTESSSYTIARNLGESTQDGRKADSVGSSLPEKTNITPTLPGSKHGV